MRRKKETQELINFTLANPQSVFNRIKVWKELKDYAKRKDDKLAKKYMDKKLFLPLFFEELDKRLFLIEAINSKKDILALKDKTIKHFFEYVDEYYDEIVKEYF